LTYLFEDADLEKIEVDPINKILFYADAGHDQIASIGLDRCETNYHTITTASTEKYN
jgi:hypothetical protein